MDVIKFLLSFWMEEIILLLWNKLPLSVLGWGNSYCLVILINWTIKIYINNFHFSFFFVLFVLFILEILTSKFSQEFMFSFLCRLLQICSSDNILGMTSPSSVHTSVCLPLTLPKSSRSHSNLGTLLGVHFFVHLWPKFRLDMDRSLPLNVTHILWYVQ